MKHGLIDLQPELNSCQCGEIPGLQWRYMKGTANLVHYQVRCMFCGKRTRDRKRIDGAIGEWFELVRGGEE